MNQGTSHYAGCYASGPKHYECALVTIKELQALVGMSDSTPRYPSREYAPPSDCWGYEVTPATGKML